MNGQQRWWLIVGAGVVVGVLLVGCVALFFGGLWVQQTATGPTSVLRDSVPIPGRFSSNGERIYFTATSNSGEPITAEMAGMGMRHQGTMSCATCHGPDGRGGTVNMMMRTFEAPDIRYSTLTEGEHDHDDAHGEEEHPPYTEETIKRAITEGVNPAGESLEWAMPRWEMSERDLDDLMEYLKTLDRKDVD